MTGAAVKASAFQVLLLALLFVFTPSLFHLVLFEVFSFLIWFEFYSGMSGVRYNLTPFRVTGVFEEPGTI